MEKLLEEFAKRKIKVIFHPLKEEISGILKFQDGNWFCIVNSSKPPSHQRFTLAHELYHFDHHRHMDGLFTNKEVNSSLERQANLYAAELLMPKEEVLSSLPDLYEPEQILSYVESLASKFEVSFQAVVRRLMELKALRKDLGEWLLSGRAQAGIPFIKGQDKGNHSSSKLPRHRPASVISPEKEPPLNYEFRYPGDPPYWVRLRQAPPEDAKLIAQGIEVAGISFEGAKENAFLFAFGKDRSLKLKRDPLNPYDQNAVEVIGNWKDEEGKECSGLLGYIPKELASRLAKEAPSSEIFATLETIILPRGKKSCGIRFSVWVSD